MVIIDNKQIEKFEDLENCFRELSVYDTESIIFKNIKLLFDDGDIYAFLLENGKAEMANKVNKIRTDVSDKEIMEHLQEIILDNEPLLIEIAHNVVNADKWEVNETEKKRFGECVYVFTAKCWMWEYLMPTGTIRDKAYRDTSDLWGAYFHDNTSLLNQFIDKLSSTTGYKIHIANKYYLPERYLSLMKKAGKTTYYGDGSTSSDQYVELVIYANGK